MRIPLYPRKAWTRNVKKTSCIVDNFGEYNEKSVQLYNAIHEYAAAGYSKRAIAKELHCSRNTVTRYLHGDYESLCRRNYRSGMDQFYDYIIKALSAGISRKDVYRRLIQKGYKGKLTAAYDYMNKIIKSIRLILQSTGAPRPNLSKRKKKFRNTITSQGVVFSVSYGGAWNFQLYTRSI